MKEAEIYKLFKDKYIAGHGTIWKPPKARFYQNDIFGIFDCVVMRPYRNGQLEFYQLTTASHRVHRLAKIEEFFSERLMDIPDYVYLALYYPMAKKFILEQVVSGSKQTFLI